MRTPRIDAAGHALVTAAVAEAERATDGEIVTVVAEASDAYHDAGLHYAVLAMLLTLALFAVRPDWLAALASDGWGTPDAGRMLAALLVIEAIVFLAARYLFAWRPLRLAVTPRRTKARRVRRRAIATFRVGAERRTAARVGVLIYLSRDERMAEIVADAAIHAAVPPERWGEAMAAMIAEVRKGRVAEGMAAAVRHVGAIVAETFPKTGGDINELPDRLIEL